MSIPLDIVKKIPTENNFFVLRGEPTLYKELHDLLYHLHKKDYVLTTDGEKVEALFAYKGPIPYVSFNYDGFVNDTLRGNRNYLTRNIIRALDFYTGKKTQTRLSYTINPWNREWFKVDVQILRHFLEKYPSMKKPYFLIFQQGVFFMQVEFSWQPIDVKMIDDLNKASLLTEKNIRMLAAYYDKAAYVCSAPQDEVVITPDGYVRLCMSYRMNDILGNLNEQSFDEIIEQSKETRFGALECPLRGKCYLAHHYKHNVNNLPSIYNNKEVSNNG